MVNLPHENSKWILFKNSSTVMMKVIKVIIIITIIVIIIIVIVKIIDGGSG